MLKRTELTKQTKKLHQEVYLRVFFTVGNHINAQLCLSAVHFAGTMNCEFWKSRRKGQSNKEGA